MTVEMVSDTGRACRVTQRMVNSQIGLFQFAVFSGVPIHKFDINDARQGRNDQDLMFGTVSVPESVDYLFTTFVRNYRGYYSQDQFTYRDDPTRAMERSMINFANLALKAVRIYAKKHEQIGRAHV